MGVVRGRWKRGGERARSTVTVAHSGKLIILSSKMMIFLWDRGKGEREKSKRGKGLLGERGEGREKGKEKEERAERDKKYLYFHLYRKEALDILGFGTLQERSTTYSGISGVGGAEGAGQPSEPPKATEKNLRSTIVETLKQLVFSLFNDDG